MKSEFGTPPHHIYGICDDDGICSNNIFSPNYDEDFSDYLDCINYLKSKKDRPTENWLHGWIKFNKKKRIKVVYLINLLTKIRKKLNV